MYQLAINWYIGTTVYPYTRAHLSVRTLTSPHLWYSFVRRWRCGGAAPYPLVASFVCYARFCTRIFRVFYFRFHPLWRVRAIWKSQLGSRVVTGVFLKAPDRILNLADELSAEQSAAMAQPRTSMRVSFDNQYPDRDSRNVQLEGVFPLRNASDAIPNPLLQAEEMDLDNMICRDECRELDKGVLYQFASPVFHLDIYFKQLFIQALPHLSMLIFPRAANYVAMGYYHASVIPLFYNHFCSLLAVLIVVLYYAMRMVDNTTMAPIQNAMWFPLLYWFMHVNTRAIKYATLHRAEYDKFMACKTSEEGFEFQKSLQIGTSWGLGARSHAIINFEITSAAIRMGSNLSHLFFVLEDPSLSLAAKEQLVYWNLLFKKVGMGACNDAEANAKGALGKRTLTAESRVSMSMSSLSPALIRRKDGSYVVMAFDAIKAILLESDAHCAKSSWPDYYLNATFALLLSLVFLFYDQFWSSMREISARLPGMSFVFGFWVYALVQVGTLYYCIIFVFLTVNKEDARRRNREATVLADLMRFADLDCNMMIVETSRAHRKWAKVGAYREPALGHASLSDETAPSEVRDMLRRKRCMLADCGAERKSAVSAAMLNEISLPLEDQEAPRAIPVAGKSVDDALGIIKLAADSDQADFIMPRISTQHRGSNNNVLVWTFIRSLFRHFGKRYKFRLDCNMAVCVVLNFALFVISLGLSIFSLVHRSGDPSEVNTIYSPFTIQCMVSSFSNVLFIITTAYCAAQVNVAFHEHLFIIDGNILQSELRRTVLQDDYAQIQRAATSAASCPATAKLSEIAGHIEDCESLQQALEICKKSILVTDEMLPVTIVGAVASHSLLGGILSMAGSGISIFISVYMSAEKMGKKNM